MKELLVKIQKVADAIKNIEKDMTVGKGNYSYKAVSDLNVVLKVKEEESKNKILSIPIKQDLVSSEVVRVNKKDRNESEMIESILYADVIKMTLRIYDLESEHYIDVESFGRGLDSADKGFGKASTYARKYALLNAYKIATGEDPDADKSTQTEIISKKDKTIQVINYLASHNEYKSDVLKHFGVSDIPELSEANFLTIYNNLTKKQLI